jgi:glycosyltransferase involved in cell wall biosynthesis
VEDLIRCLSLVKEKVHNVSLLIAGEGSLKDELVSIAKELGVEDSLLLLGNVSQDMLSDLYYSADVILFTHAGITLVEAALSGRPIASYDHDWAGEFIGYEERGLLAEFRDVDALAQRVIRLLKDGALSAVLGRAARDFALKHFNEKEISDIERSVFEKFFKKDT